MIWRAYFCKKTGILRADAFLEKQKVEVKNMQPDDIRLLREIQKNTEMGQKAIETLLPKVDDPDFSHVLSRQELQYSNIHDKASRQILDSSMRGYHSSALGDLMLRGSVLMNTAFNTSNSHIAGMMIQGSSRGLTDLWKAMNHSEQAGESSRKLAEELMEFEEKCVAQLREYL